ncbi:MAG: efflux RND transporter periplasmic adaptor subunit [Rikenellaceae bacterium]
MKRVIYCAAMLAVITSCGQQQQQQAVVSEEVPKVATTTTLAIAQVITIDETYASEIKAYKENMVTPAASGVRVDEILVEVGDRVKKGELVATLDPTQYNQQMTSLKNLRADFERLESVYKAGGISLQTLEQSKTNLAIQEEVAKNLKTNIEVLSPITGVVTARNTESGNLFLSQPILNIMQIDQLKVTADVPELYFPDVKLGMNVELTTEVYPGEVFEGKVSLIAPAINADARTFSVEVTFPNSSERLRPGMFGRTKFSMREKAGILVPDIAVQKQMGTDDRFVYVNNNGVAERKSVTIGRLVGSHYDILSGVEVGDEIVTTAFSRISDGTKIEVK